MTVTVWRLVWRHGLWGPVIALPLAACLGWSGGNQIVTALAVRNAVETQGTVLRLDRGSHAARLSAPRIGTRTWSVTYRFEGPEGATVTGRAAIPPALHGTLAVGGPIRLRHAPAAPGRHDPVGSLTLRHGIALSALSVILGLGGLALLWLFGPQAASMWRAARSGPARGATVTDLVPRYPALADHPDRRVVWRGPATGAEGRSLRWRRRDLPEPGETIRVRIDPRSGRTWWEADL
ncbi:MAG: DUF3592 domain-containing protein [Gemmobacter sp.]